MNGSPQFEILDLRHFSSAQLGPLLRDEALRWEHRLHWDYSHSSNLLLDYIDSRVLPGFVALHNSPGGSRGAIAGYTFGVYEAAKAVIGDVFAFGETGKLSNPVCETLLHPLLDLLLASPGVDRVESQLLMFPAGALAAPFLARGFRSHPRLFMVCDLDRFAARQAPSVSASSFLVQPWRPEFYNPAAELIHRCYAGHIDSSINDQYRSLPGAHRFLHNIIRFPGCGVFDPESSWVLRDPQTLALEAVLLCSRVREDVGHITQLCISPALRGHGLGRLLLQHCMDETWRNGVKSLSLTVTQANTAAVNLYQRSGFNTLHRFEAMVWDRTESQLL
jgi:ribosomal protein S18 acetylase RimI-like enzyme